MNLLPDRPREIVSIQEIDDYLTNRGAWKGYGFELASTPAKRLAFWRSIVSRWSMRAGWIALVVLAVPALSVLVALAASAMAGVWPGWFPEWVRRIGSDVPALHVGAVEPQLLFLLIPPALWLLALIVTGTSHRFRVITDTESEITHVTFLEPLISGGLLGNPEVFIYSEDESRGEAPLCLPVLALPEDLLVGKDPEERHLLRCAAQCLLVESAYDTPIDVGILRYRNRAVSLLMTDFARRRTTEVIDEIRSLQTVQHHESRSADD